MKSKAKSSKVSVPSASQQMNERLLREKESFQAVAVLQDQIIDSLAKEYKMNSELEDLLFDYIFNAKKGSKFTDYLKNLGHTWEPQAPVNAQPFTVTINDGRISYEYKLQAPKNYSIHDVSKKLGEAGAISAGTKVKSCKPPTPLRPKK